MDEINPRMLLIVEMADSHIRAAHYLAWKCHQMEEVFKSNPEENPFYFHRAYVTGCIFLSVAFIEASINELIIGANIGKNPWDKKDAQKRFESLRDFGSIEGVKKSSTLDKYQMTLSVLGLPLYDSSRLPYQDVKLLVKLRNSLVHSEPEHVYIEPDAEDEYHRFHRLFKSKFPPNPIAVRMKHNFYPDIILGYGCARWSVTISLDFVKDFYKRIGIYSQFYDSIEVLP